MSTTLLAFTMALTQAVDPDHDHTNMAGAIADVVAVERPLFPDDDDREKTAALIVAVAWREGSLRESILGDCDVHTGSGVCVSGPRSWCTMQVHQSSGGDASLNDDLAKCIRTGMTMLRTSMRVCPEHPLAFYCAGPRGFKGDRAQRISRDRVALATRLRAAARTAMEKEASP